MCGKEELELTTTIVHRTNNPENGYEDEGQLLLDTLTHMDDVEECMKNIASYIEDIGEWHDWSKIHYFDDFKRDCLERLDIPNFKERGWYNIHTCKERHHINARVPSDVNFFDIIEMFVDCIIAGKTRSGEVNDSFLVLPQSVINEAYWNTIKLLKEKIILEE